MDALLRAEPNWQQIFGNLSTLFDFGAVALELHK